MNPFLIVCFTGLIWMAPVKAESLAKEDAAAPQAVASSAAKAIHVLHLQNPAHYAGIQIGDVLQRRITLSVPESLQLQPDKLPIRGVQRNGIELRQVQETHARQADKMLYTLTFEYQVFASSGQPVQLALPPEQIVLTSGASVTLPAWRFWLMAQLPERMQPAKPTLLGQHRAALLDTHSLSLGLLVSGGLALLGSLILLYRNASWAWLPMLNGPFAQAYRRLQRLPATQEGATRAALAMQQAFNQHFGQQMLASQVPMFVAKQPAFAAYTEQIQQFYAQSNTLLYGNQLPAAADYLQQCKMLTRQLRSCERGV